MSNFINPTAKVGAKKINLLPIKYVAIGAGATIALTFIVWATINLDVLWKAIRFPEAVRQMEVEVLIKKDAPTQLDKAE